MKNKLPLSHAMKILHAVLNDTQVDESPAEINQCQFHNMFFHTKNRSYKTVCGRYSVIAPLSFGGEGHGDSAEMLVVIMDDEDRETILPILLQLSKGILPVSEESLEKVNALARLMLRFDYAYASYSGFYFDEVEITETELYIEPVVKY